MFQLFFLWIGLSVAHGAASNHDDKGIHELYGMMEQFCLEQEKNWKSLLDEESEEKREIGEVAKLESKSFEKIVSFCEEKYQNSLGRTSEKLDDWQRIYMAVNNYSILVELVRDVDNALSGLDLVFGIMFKNLDAFGIKEKESKLWGYQFDAKSEFWGKFSTNDLKMLRGALLKTIKTDHRGARHDESRVAKVLGAGIGFSFSAAYESLATKAVRLYTEGQVRDTTQPWEKVFTFKHQNLINAYYGTRVDRGRVVEFYLMDDFFDTVPYPDPESESSEKLVYEISDTPFWEDNRKPKRLEIVKMIRSFLSIKDKDLLYPELISPFARE